MEAVSEELFVAILHVIVSIRQLANIALSQCVARGVACFRRVQTVGD